MNVDMERLSAHLAAAGLHPDKAEQIAGLMQTTLDETRREMGAKVEQARASMVVDVARQSAEIALRRQGFIMIGMFVVGFVTASLVFVTAAVLSRPSTPFPANFESLDPPRPSSDQR